MMTPGNKLYKKFILIGGICSFLVIFPIGALAQQAPAENKFGELTGTDCSTIGIDCGKGGNITKGEPIIGYLQKAVSVILSFVSIGAVIAIIYGGVLYITSSGDDGQAKTAKNVIKYAIIGLIVVGLSAITVNFIISNFRSGGGGANNGGGNNNQPPK